MGFIWLSASIPQWILSKSEIRFLLKSAKDQHSGEITPLISSGAAKSKEPSAHERAQKITYCRDSYRLTTADGKSRLFWERNLRFKTDVSERTEKWCRRGLPSCPHLRPRASS